MRKTLLCLAKAAVSLALLALALRLVDARAVGRLFGGAEPRPLALAALLLAAAGFCGAGAWFCILRARLPGLSFATVAAAHWSGMFFNTFLPSNVGGDVVRGVLIAREALPRGFVIASLLADRALGLLCLAAIGAVALAAGHGRPGLAATLAAASLAATAATPAAARAALRRLGCGTAAPPPRLARAFAPLLETVAAPRRLLPLLLCGGAAQALRVWQNVFVIRALALDIPEAAVWGIIPVFGIVSALPLTIGGLGLRECAARALAGPAGLDAAHLTALSLAGHAMVALVNLPGIVPFLRRRRTGDQ